MEGAEWKVRTRTPAYQLPLNFILFKKVLTPIYICPVRPICTLLFPAAMLPRCSRKGPLKLSSFDVARKSQDARHLKFAANAYYHIYLSPDDEHKRDADLYTRRAFKRGTNLLNTTRLVLLILLVRHYAQQLRVDTIC